MLPNTKTTTEINGVLSAFHFIYKSSYADQYCQFESVGVRNSFFLTDTEGVAKTHDWE